ncbi:MAG: outer membrane lipoprotein-sorting protein [Pseudomonadota bacterium]|nr:outer membrane lipoprotein-sorting protein [Pseudomonadota bacterium]
MKLKSSHLTLVVSIGLISISGSAIAIESAEEIYKKGVKIFVHKSIGAIIDSTIHYENGDQEKRAFFLAKKEQNSDKSSILIRFLEPDDIKCTAVLVNKIGDKDKRYAYFPALKRVRIIPESDKGKEVFGIGISYEDLGAPQGQFEEPKEIDREGVIHYQLTLVDSSKTSQYLIDSTSYQLKEMNVLKNGDLEKKVVINEIKPYFGDDLITSWNINYPKTNRSIQYSIRPDSITEKLKDSLFHKNKLKRCKF